jgi:hypothetical protein
MHDAIDGPADTDRLAYIALHVFEIRLGCKMLDVLVMAGNQVVYGNYLMPFRNQALTEV